MVETTIIFDRQMRESDRFCFMIPRQSVVVVAVALLALLLTLCGLTGRKLPRGGPGLSGLVHEEAPPSISYQLNLVFLQRAAMLALQGLY